MAEKKTKRVVLFIESKLAILTEFKKEYSK